MVTIKEEVTVSRDDCCFAQYEDHFTADRGWEKSENEESVTYSRKQEISTVVRV